MGHALVNHPSVILSLQSESSESYHLKTGIRKPSFNKLDQMFLNLKEATTNISYVKHAIRQRWGAVYTLVTL